MNNIAKLGKLQMCETHRCTHCNVIDNFRFLSKDKEGYYYGYECLGCKKVFRKERTKI